MRVLIHSTMAKFSQQMLLVLVIMAVVHRGEATFFLSAITSALGTIPFTAGPMAGGLVGAKLAVGSKLLYYLGFFGSRRSKRKPAPVATSPSKQGFGLGGTQFPGEMQAMPLPYAFGGGFPQFGGGFQGGNPNYLAPYGYDPAQLYQILASQGIDPFTAMQALNFGGAAGNQAIAAAQFPFSTGGGHGPPASTGLGSAPKVAVNAPSSVAVDSPQMGDEPNVDVSDGDVESFFTFLRDMDDNTCISRLMCDIGANPSFLGEFSENIHGIISSLDVLPSSGAFQYISIMETGRREGSCAKRFPQCSDAAYEIVKNVAPSVSMPQNVNSDIVNQL